MRREKQGEIELRAIAWGSYVSFHREKGNTYVLIAQKTGKSTTRIRQLDLKHQRQHVRFMRLCMPFKHHLLSLME